MSSRMQPKKILQDISVWISELKKEFISRNHPVNDDSAALHQFEEKLEWILLFGLFEKPAILGPKKSYWNFINACFNSSKRSHDGIKFVKSVTSLKSSLGRGRAFIRFCLIQKCLADTLQSCFMNKKISRDFYSDKSVIVQELLWSVLVTSLYELNEINFDFNAALPELDISWPKYARKLFTSQSMKVTEGFACEDLSTVNLQSFPSQDKFDASNMVELNEEPSEHYKCLQDEIKQLKEERSRLKMDIYTLRKEYESVQSFLPRDVLLKLKTTEDNDSLCINFTNTGKVEDQTALKPYNKNTESCNKINTDDHLLLTNISSKDNTGENCSAFYSSEKENNASNFSDLSVNKSFDNLQNRDTNIADLLLDFKTVIDDIEGIIQKSEITLAIPYILHLRKIRHSIEECYLDQVKKSKESINFNCFIDNCIACIKSFVLKQEIIINSLQENVDLSIKENQSLYSKISTLKDLLKSYGFLKVSNEKEVDNKNILLPLTSKSIFMSKPEVFTCDNIAHNPVLKRIFVPLTPVLNSTFVKLSNLYEKIIELQFGLDSVQELNSNLITRVQDQELHLKGVTKELEEAQHLVSVLKTQHRKLQSAEGIFKYDLQEKRKLLNRLKQQLEDTHEDFNLVRIKNSKSEAEWQDLHKEFVQRHKQASEESGFIYDKGFEDYESTSNSSCSSSLSIKDITQDKSSVKNEYEEVPVKKSRLELLEEECHHLYSSLLQSSKRRLDIDKRLEIMCRKIEKSNNRIIHSTAIPNDLNTETNLVINDALVNPEDFCQNVIPSDNFTNSPHSSSDVGSLNSECSSSVPGLCNDTNLSDSCSYESSKADSCISLSPSKLQIDAIPDVSIIEQNNDDNSISNPDSIPAFNSDSIDEKDMISACDALELTGNNKFRAQLQDLSLSHVDSLLIKKKDLEESLEILKISSELECDKESFIDSMEVSKQISKLEEEKSILLNKVEDLEKKNLEICTELSNVTQQLILSKAAKEHEVAALQFQLNTEALKYERSIKEFSEQNEGLENMKEKVNDQEELIHALEEALSEIRLDHENEKEQQWEESLSENEKERSKNKILMSHLEEIKIHNQKDKESMEAELCHLQNDTKDLKKRLIKLLKEKDLLWKRSSQLYHMQKIKIDDRWMNDADVSSCLGCKNNFSFLLRKHHCRICGRIFCYSCSNNWLFAASSRKKIRACNECFVQYMQMRNDARRGSDVPLVEEDSGDDEFDYRLSFIPKCDSSIHSDVPSSIVDSTVSLPFTQKHSVPFFSSAPDLRFVTKSEDTLSSDKLFTDENILEENNSLLLAKNEDIKYLKSDEYEISSDEHTSITLGKGISKRTNRLKDISVEEIKADERGFSSEFVIHSGEKIDLPVFCQTCPSVLQWWFKSNCLSIPFQIIHSNASRDNESSITYEVKYAMQDEMELSVPGYYVFHFDNSFRDTEVKVQFTFISKK